MLNPSRSSQNLRPSPFKQPSTETPGRWSCSKIFGHFWDQQCIFLCYLLFLLFKKPLSDHSYMKSLLIFSVCSQGLSLSGHVVLTVFLSASMCWWISVQRCIPLMQHGGGVGGSRRWINTKLDKYQDKDKTIWWGISGPGLGGSAWMYSKGWPSRKSWAIPV